MERIEEEKRIRDQEIKRREAERKKRHEEMARDSKKSFFELNQGATAPSTKSDNLDSKHAIDNEQEDGEIESSVPAAKKLKSIEEANKSLTGKNEIDMNALDYEIDRDENADEANVIHKNEIVAQALGVEVRADKSVELHATKSNTNDRSEKKEHSSKKSDRKRHSKSVDREQKGHRRRSRTRSRSRSRSRDRRARNGRGGKREIDRRRNNYSPPRRNNDRRRNDYRTQRDRRRSRSGSHHDKYRRNRRYSR